MSRKRPYIFPIALAGCILVALGGLPGCGLIGTGDDTKTPEAGENGGAEAEALTPTDEPRVAYEVTLEGVEDDELADMLRRTSQLIALADDPPRSEAGLRRRAREDVERLRTALRSEGFYAGEVDYEIDTAADPAAITLNITPGTVYLLAAVEIAYTRDLPAEPAVPREAGALNLEIGMRARAPAILRAERRLLTSLENSGYPQAEVADRRTTVDHDETTMEVQWRIDPGPLLRFGEMRVEGLENVDAAYIEEFRTWEPAATFDQRQVANTRKKLTDTGLFASVAVERGEPEDDRVPVIYRFEERAHRSLGFSARFSTSEGPSGTAFWEHRNFFGRNETLRASLTVGEIEQSLRTDFSKPRFLREDQKLIANAEARRLDSDAFREEAIASFLGLEREFSDIWTGSAGGSLELTRDTDNEGQRTFELIGAPLSLTRDTRNDVLDPTRGSRLAVETTPYFQTGAETEVFLRNVVAGSAYFALDDDERFVLAGRGRLGSIVGAQAEDITAGKRFFAGGGGSIRGFNFQEVGPLDDDDDPLGGRSLIELSLETRIRVFENFGVVPFIDAGNVFDSVLPEIGTSGEKALRFAGGLGLRYFTGIGPVRFDVAFPLNPRDVDDTFEFYISLGQAF